MRDRKRQQARVERDRKKSKTWTSDERRATATRRSDKDAWRARHRDDKQREREQRRVLSDSERTQRRSDWDRVLKTTRYQKDTGEISPQIAAEQKEKALYERRAGKQRGQAERRQQKDDLRQARRLQYDNMRARRRHRTAGVRTRSGIPSSAYDDDVDDIYATEGDEYYGDGMRMEDDRLDRENVMMSSGSGGDFVSVVPSAKRPVYSPTFGNEYRDATYGLSPPTGNIVRDRHGRALPLDRAYRTVFYPDEVRVPAPVPAQRERYLSERDDYRRDGWLDTGSGLPKLYPRSGRTTTGESAADVAERDDDNDSSSVMDAATERRIARRRATVEREDLDRDPRMRGLVVTDAGGLAVTQQRLLDEERALLAGEPEMIMRAKGLRAQRSAWSPERHRAAMAPRITKQRLAQLTKPGGKGHGTTRRSLIVKVLVSYGWDAEHAKRFVDLDERERQQFVERRQRLREAALGVDDYTYQEEYARFDNWLALRGLPSVAVLLATPQRPPPRSLQRDAQMGNLRSLSRRRAKERSRRSAWASNGDLRTQLRHLSDVVRSGAGSRRSNVASRLCALAERIDARGNASRGVTRGGNKVDGSCADGVNRIGTKMGSTADGSTKDGMTDASTAGKATSVDDRSSALLTADVAVDDPETMLVDELRQINTELEHSDYDLSDYSDQENDVRSTETLGNARWVQPNETFTQDEIALLTLASLESTENGGGEETVEADNDEQDVDDNVSVSVAAKHSAKTRSQRLAGAVSTSGATRNAGGRLSKNEQEAAKIRLQRLRQKKACAKARWEAAKHIGLLPDEENCENVADVKKRADARMLEYGLSSRQTLAQYIDNVHPLYERAFYEPEYTTVAGVLTMRAVGRTVGCAYADFVRSVASVTAEKLVPGASVYTGGMELERARHDLIAALALFWPAQRHSEQVRGALVDFSDLFRLGASTTLLCVFGKFKPETHENDDIDHTLVSVANLLGSLCSERDIDHIAATANSSPLGVEYAQVLKRTTCEQHDVVDQSTQVKDTTKRCPSALLPPGEHVDLSPSEKSRFHSMKSGIIYRNLSVGIQRVLATLQNDLKDLCAKSEWFEFDSTQQARDPESKLPSIGRVSSPSGDDAATTMALVSSASSSTQSSAASPSDSSTERVPSLDGKIKHQNCAAYLQIREDIVTVCEFLHTYVYALIAAYVGSDIGENYWPLTSTTTTATIQLEEVPLKGSHTSEQTSTVHRSMVERPAFISDFSKHLACLARQASLLIEDTFGVNTVTPFEHHEHVAYCERIQIVIVQLFAGDAYASRWEVDIERYCPRALRVWFHELRHCWILYRVFYELSGKAQQCRVHSPLQLVTDELRNVHSQLASVLETLMTTMIQTRPSELTMLKSEPSVFLELVRIASLRMFKLHTERPYEMHLEIAILLTELMNPFFL